MRMWIKTAGSHFEASLLLNSYGLLNLDTGNVIQINSYPDQGKDFYTVEFFPSFKIPETCDFETYKDKKWLDIQESFIWKGNVVCIKAVDTFEEAKVILDKLAEKLGAEVIDIDQD